MESMQPLSAIGTICMFDLRPYIILNLVCRCGERYRGQYKYNEDPGQISGNPARAAVIEDLMTTIKNRYGASGESRNHVEAITIDDMTQLVRFSEAQFPVARLTAKISDIAEFLECTKHAMMQAFASDLDEVSLVT
jgi:hypothetical protein